MNDKKRRGAPPPRTTATTHGENARDHRQAGRARRRRTAGLLEEGPAQPGPAAQAARQGGRPLRQGQKLQTLEDEAVRAGLNPDLMKKAWRLADDYDEKDIEAIPVGTPLAAADRIRE